MKICLRKIGLRKTGPWKTQKQKIVGCVWNVRMWSIYEIPKFDNKPFWTPLVSYSLVHMYDREVNVF